MRKVGAFEAKNTLGTLLDLVAQGEEVIITRHGKSVARLVPENEQPDRRAALAAAARLRRRRRQASLAGLSIRDLIDEGRR